MSLFEYTEVRITEASDVTQEVLEVAENLFCDWFDDGGPIDWERYWERFEDYELPSKKDTRFDFGPQLDTPAMRKIQKHIRAYKKL